MSTLRKPILSSASMTAALVTPGAVVAQQALPGEQLASQSLRPYWLVFIAYAIAIVLVMVWAGSIAKRLSDVESRLSE